KKKIDADKESKEGVLPARASVGAGGHMPGAPLPGPPPPGAGEGKRYAPVLAAATAARFPPGCSGAAGHGPGRAPPSGGRRRGPAAGGRGGAPGCSGWPWLSSEGTPDNAAKSGVSPKVLWTWV